MLPVTDKSRLEGDDRELYTYRLMDATLIKSGLELQFGALDRAIHEHHRANDRSCRLDPYSGYGDQAPGRCGGQQYDARRLGIYCQRRVQWSAITCCSHLKRLGNGSMRQIGGAIHSNQANRADNCPVLLQWD